MKFIPFLILILFSLNFWGQSDSTSFKLKGFEGTITFKYNSNIPFDSLKTLEKNATAIKLLKRNKAILRLNSRIISKNQFKIKKSYLICCIGKHTRSRKKSSCIEEWEIVIEDQDSIFMQKRVLKYVRCKF